MVFFDKSLARKTVLEPAMKRNIYSGIFGCLIFLSFFAFFLSPVRAQSSCLTNANLSQRDSTDFTFVIVTDTHTGGAESSYTPGNFAKVTKWIADHRFELNVQFLFHLGDVTAGTRGIIPVANQWTEADTAMKNLEWNLPYSITPGNRDDFTYFNQYFGPSRFFGRPWYGGGFPAGSNTSSYYLFSAGGYGFVVFTGDDYNQAKQVFQNYANRNGIYALHAYVNADGTVASSAVQNMIKGQNNIFMALNGHTHCYPGSNICRNTLTNDSGHTVYQITHPSSPIIRLYMFRPKYQIICAYTYNPVANTFYTQANSQFSLPWNMRFGGSLPTATSTPKLLSPTPTKVPTKVPTKIPTPTPTKIPTIVPTKVPTMTPTRVPTIPPTSTPPPGGSCTECPTNFNCYQMGSEYQWFVAGYVMEGFVSASSSSCSGVAKPQFLGKTKGDANCDGKINIYDYSLWHGNFYAGNLGSVVKNNWNADFTGTNGVCDGKVDVLDYSQWYKYFNELGK